MAVSLFHRLPAELLRLILELAETDSTSAPLLPYTFGDARDGIVQELFGRSFSNDWENDEDFRMLAARTDDRHLRYRHARYSPPDDDDATAYSYQTAILSSLKNLRHLDFEYFDPVDIPKHFTDALATFSHLQTLCLATEGPTDHLTFEDSTFCLGRALPSLSHFRSSFPLVPLVQLLSQPCPNLKRLDVWIDAKDRDSFACLPWSSLTSLTLDVDIASGVKPLRFFSSSLKKALFPSNVRLSSPSTNDG